MQKDIKLFKNVKSIIKKGEILYSMEGLLEYFGYNYNHSNFLIQKFIKSYSNLQIKKIKFSSSYDYYLNTQNSLRLLMLINTEKSKVYKEWLIKCGIERINEIISPINLYDRLKTIIYMKGIKSNYNFIKSELIALDSKISYVELDQQILDEDIVNNKVKLKPTTERKVSVVRFPRDNSTQIL